MKWFKKLSLLAMAGGLLAGAGGVAPASVSAQAPSLDQLLNETVKKMAKTQTVHTVGELKISANILGLGDDTLLEGKFETSLDLDKAKGFGSVYFNSSAGDYKLIASLEDGTLYGKENGEDQLQTLDVRTEVEEFQAALKQVRAMDQGFTPADLGIDTKLFEIKEIENGYELRLREDIDGKQVYRDNQVFWNMASAAAIYQSRSDESQTEQQKNISEALTRHAINEEAFGAFFANKPKFVIQVDKDFQIQSLELDMSFTIEQDQTKEIGFSGTSRIQGKLTFDRYNEGVEVLRP